MIVKAHQDYGDHVGFAVAGVCLASMHTVQLIAYVMNIAALPSFLVKFYVCCKSNMTKNSKRQRDKVQKCL